jgi:hypothetical protein
MKTGSPLVFSRGRFGVSSIIEFLRRNRYGSFALTEAIRPGCDFETPPGEGYREETYRDCHTGKTMPMITATATAEKLFDLFLDLIVPLGETTNVILESSHDGSLDSVQSCRRCGIDTPVLSSYCCEYEDLLLNDGCTAISTLNDRRGLEVQLDEHKILRIYGHKLNPFRRVLRRYGLSKNPDLKLICDFPHFHHSTCRFQEEFQELAGCIGAEHPSRVFSDDNG